MAKKARIDGHATPGNAKTTDRWSSEDKFLVVLETYVMNQSEFAEYCRKKGLYKEQIDAWRSTCLHANTGEINQTKRLSQELKEEKKRSIEIKRDLRKKRESVSRGCCIITVKKKGPSDLGGRRGRMISPSDRILAVKLIQEANQNGTRLEMACDELNINVRTYQRWVSDGGVREDQRPHVPRPEPKNKLTAEEKEAIITISKKKEFVDLPPSQIVPKLADQSIYIASESSFYRVLREENLQHHRGRSKRPQRKLPESYFATAPNQVWTWDITWI